VKRRKRKSSPKLEPARYYVSSRIPIPEIRGDPNRYPLKRMKVGSSFAFQEAEENRVRQAVFRYRENGAKSVKFTIRGEGKGRRRIWRIA
jgi:hypothetical protein